MSEMSIEYAHGGGLVAFDWALSNSDRKGCVEVDTVVLIFFPGAESIKNTISGRFGT